MKKLLCFILVAIVLMVYSCKRSYVFKEETNTISRKNHRLKEMMIREYQKNSTSLEWDQTNRYYSVWEGRIKELNVTNDSNNRNRFQKEIEINRYSDSLLTIKEIIKANHKYEFYIVNVNVTHVVNDRVFLSFEVDENKMIKTWELIDYFKNLKKSGKEYEKVEQEKDGIKIIRFKKKK
tara:strand:+ start:6 stop:542 length:537 start_codon:yes stop_codon:yes gene_type:complete